MDANRIILRRFAPADAATVITWPQSLTEARWWAGPHSSWPVPLAVLNSWHSDPDVRPYILSRGTVLLGYGELWLDIEAQEVELARLIIAPAQRRQGLGQQLVRQLLAEVETASYPHVFLRLFPDNQHALGCYQQAGFRLVSAAEQQSFNQGQPLAYHWMRAVQSQSDQADQAQG